MFEELRQAFREALENFKKELNRDQVPEAVDRLVGAMRRELVQAKADLSKLEDEIKATLQALEDEKREVKTCRRRETMAQEIGDEETAEVARGFAEKHERRASVLERKALALQDELDLRKAEVEEMTETVQKAGERRADLATRAGRAQGRRSIQEADTLFEEFRRMGERVDEMQARADASEIMSEEFPTDASSGQMPPHGPSPEGVERRLEELKRRMQSE